MKLRGTIYNKDTDEELGGCNWRSSSSKIQRVKWEVAEISTWNVERICSKMFTAKCQWFKLLPLYQNQIQKKIAWIVQEGVEHWPEDEGEVKKPINN